MPVLLVFFGLIASGKSTVADAFARRNGMLYLNTDRVRKELAGLAATERRPEGRNQGIYSPEYTERTYQTMLDLAAEQLRQGKGAVLDGSYSRRSDRDRVLECGVQYGADVRFILCHCSEEEVRRRLELRAHDPLAVSDGRWDIYLQQKKHFENPEELEQDRLLLLDTDEAPDLLLQTVMNWLDGNP